MKSEVVYLVSGGSHCERLAVSLFTLRRHWPGPVRILDLGGTDGLAERIAIGADAKHEVISIPRVGSGKNAIYAAKASIGSFLKEERSLFLDCDTTVHDNPQPLLAMLGAYPLVVTRFSNWSTTDNTLQSRLRKWLKCRAEVLNVPAVASRLMDEPHAAINTGVFAVRRSCAFLADWPLLVAVNPGFICDEIAAQLLITKHPHCLVGDRWNHSPQYGVDPAPAIRHYHGGKHSGHPVWESCRELAAVHQFCGLEEWS